MYKKPDYPDHYDKVTNHYDELHYKKKKGVNHDIGEVPDMIIPKEEEIRLLGNANKNCTFYIYNSEVCHN